MTAIHPLQRFREIRCNICSGVDRVHPVYDLIGFYRPFCYSCARNRFGHLMEYYCCNNCGEFNHEREGAWFVGSQVYCWSCYNGSRNVAIDIEWVKEGF
jgi:hypothetical protein